jgi:hypothetical protein
MRLKYIVIIGFFLLLGLAFTWPKITASSTSPRIKDPVLAEVSGLVFSARNPGDIWVHNDGANKIRLFLIDKQGNFKAVFDSKKRIRDWEDIAIDQGLNGKSYIYAGDIGDNEAKRKLIRVFRFREPSLNDDTDELKDLESIMLKYPDGSRDAEAMLIDPISRKLYIITKREANPHIYSTSIDSLVAGDTISLKKAGELHIKGVKMLGWVTAADISRDGLQVLVRTYGNVYYWKRKPEQSLEQALKGEPVTLKHVGELQGEAIGFTPDGKGYYTLGEGRNPTLNFNRIKE